jgi:hypothetical protein
MKMALDIMKFHMRTQHLLTSDIIQQILECLVIGIMIFPIAEITDTAGLIDIFRPGLIAIHYGGVNTDGEEYGFFAFIFLGKGRIHLIFNPIA